MIQTLREWLKRYNMLSVGDIICIHDSMIDTYGGIKGIRDKGLLSSIINGVHQTYGGIELYPTDLDKICRIYYMFVTNQVFLDGNKRTATGVALVLLYMYNYDIPKEFNTDSYRLALDVSNGKISYEELIQIFGGD